MEETELGSTTQAGAATARAGKTDVRLPRGASLGRYVVLGPVGAGGMGVVYAAYDPELDRKVAIKLMHPSADAASASGRGLRLLREAQSLARLQHPEVLTVLDVGVHEGQVFVAMEFVEGQTLRRWLQERPRTWREVLDVYVAAGRGLAAAHAKGLVHRDFKPDNVMLDVDAHTGAVVRVRVMDFGLARSGEPDATTGATAPGISTATQDVDLTRTGALMGTPAYMAPEQHRGQQAHARSDQFAFCVAIYEGLYGERPFAGQSLPEIVATTTIGTIRAAPSGPGVPRWLRDVIVRGLSTEPEDRWPSMADLLDALRRDPTGRRRRQWAAVLILGAAAGTWGLVQLRERQRLAACDDASRAIDEVWNDHARTQVEAALLATQASYAAQTWALVQPRIDAQAEAWRVARRESCALRGDLEVALWPVQDECFASSRTALADRIAILADADSAIVNRAIALVGDSRVDEACLDPARLARRERLRDDAAEREELAELERQLERAGILETAGEYDEAERVAADVQQQAEALGATRLAATARARRGETLNAMARYPEAERELEAAYFAAQAVRDESAASEAAVALTAVVGASLARRAEGLRWGRQARVLLDLLGDEGDDAAALEHNLGVVEITAGDYATAIAHLERSLELRLRTRGEHSPGVIRVLRSLGAAYDGQDEVPRAIEHLERALALSEEVFGLDHPLVGDANNDLGAALLSADEFPRAVAHFERAVAIHEAAKLEERTASALDNLALATQNLGRPADALAINQRALEIRERMFPAGHPVIGNTLVNRGTLLHALGRAREAASAFARAITIYEESLGPQHERVSDACFNLANASLTMGEPDAAFAAAVRSLAIRRHELRAGHPKIDQAVLMHSVTALAMDKPGLAIDELRRALAEPPDPPRPAQVEAQMQAVLGDALLSTGDAKQALEVLTRAKLDALPPADGARARFLLARAAWESGGDRAAAYRRASEAVAEFRAAREDGDPDLARLAAWLATHRAR